LQGATARLIPIEHSESNRALAVLELTIPTKKLEKTRLDMAGFSQKPSIKPVNIEPAQMRLDRDGRLILILDFGPQVNWKIDNLSLRSQYNRERGQ